MLRYQVGWINVSTCDACVLYQRQIQYATELILNISTYVVLKHGINWGHSLLLPPSAGHNQRKKCLLQQVLCLLMCRSRTNALKGCYAFPKDAVCVEFPPREEKRNIYIFPTFVHGTSKSFYGKKHTTFLYYRYTNLTGIPRP